MTQTGRKSKSTYVGAPACFVLDMACEQIAAAFDGIGEYSGIFLVGSALERCDWRDVDVRMMLSDDGFRSLFPGAALSGAAWEHDKRWRLLTVVLSHWLRGQTGLPVDFQFQPMSWANERHKGPRSALGFSYCPVSR